MAAGNSFGAGGDGAGRADEDVVEHAARSGRLKVTDDAYRQLMKHAHRLAMDGHGELAQFLRDAMTDAQRYSWLRGNAVREKNLGDKFIEFHCDFESWNDIDAAIDKARMQCEHRWAVTHEGAQYMDCRCDRCGSTKRETWD
ncbi:hypothetical protein [Candidatus Accumulibacter vicinus]|uniref:hypothetical protein n=1 Tax=Candidatus Accumulibacter vicinus TaxID=2954382 RepID=UPI00235B6B6F|nr:hypothetical protein [Candidatus Accumulibacter vicinus]